MGESTDPPSTKYLTLNSQWSTSDAAKSSEKSSREKSSGKSSRSSSSPLATTSPTTSRSRRPRRRRAVLSGRFATSLSWPTIRPAPRSCATCLWTVTASAAMAGQNRARRTRSTRRSRSPACWIRAETRPIGGGARGRRPGRRATRAIPRARGARHRPSTRGRRARRRRPRGCAATRAPTPGRAPPAGGEEEGCTSQERGRGRGTTVGDAPSGDTRTGVRRRSTCRASIRARAGPRPAAGAPRDAAAPGNAFALRVRFRRFGRNMSS